MRPDFSSHLGAVDREVTALERAGEPARAVTLRRLYDTTPDDLWEAVTDPERLARWFAPVGGDLRAGGRYRIEGNAEGTITDCDPPRFLAANWEFGGGTSWIELRIASEDEGARLTLSHICPLDDFWTQYGPGAVGVGWDLGLLGLALYVADPDWQRFDENAFAASPEGRAFIVGSSRDWRRAALAGGEDAAQADAAASRTTAFYTGQDPA